MRHGLSVVIPAYNEEAGIQGVMGALLKSLSDLQPAVESEIIVVDDGSVDRTSDVVRGIDHDDVVLISHEVNRGYGAALKTGIRHARFDWVLITDADGTYPSSAIRDLFLEREGFDMIVGDRSGTANAIPLIRRPPKWLLQKLASYLSRRQIPDLNSGLRLIRHGAVEEFRHILPEGFSFTATITLAMLSSGYNVKYVPISYLKRKGTSKVRPIYDTLNFLRLIIRTIMYFDPLRVFVPLSLGFMLTSLLVGVASYVFLDKILDSTTVLLFIAGIQLLAIGMLADVMNRRLGR